MLTSSNLPQMPDETSRKYMFAAIDRATRWVYMEIRATKSADSAQRFVNNLMQKAPFVISKIFTDNGKEFTDRFCATHGIEKENGDGFIKRSQSILSNFTFHQPDS